MTSPHSPSFLAVWSAELTASQRTPRTVEAYVRHVNWLASWLGRDPFAATTADIYAYLAHQRPHWQAATERLCLSALRSYFGWTQRQSLRADCPLVGIVRPRRTEQRQTIARRRPVQPTGALALDIASYLRQCMLADVSAASLALYRQQLSAWLDWRQRQCLPDDLAAVDVVELRAYFVYLRQEHRPHQANRYRATLNTNGLAPTTLRSIWRTLAGFWGFLAREDKLRPDQANIFRDRRVPIPKVRAQLRSFVETETVAAMLDAITGDSELALRDRAIILLLRQSGMRIDEVCRLRDEMINDATAIIVGKGGKERHVGWGRAAAEALAAYQHVRRGPKTGPTFRSTGSRARLDRALRPDSLRQTLKQRAANAGVSLPAGAPIHGLRHAFAIYSLERGMDLADLQTLFGHSNLETTRIYAGLAARRKAMREHRRLWDDDLTD